MEMHVLSLSPHVSSHFLCCCIQHQFHQTPCWTLIKSLKLVWMGSDLWIVPNKMWFPSLQGLPELFVQIMAMPRDQLNAG